MGSTSFWQASFPQSELEWLTKEPLRGTQHTDVAIIGGGVTGVAAALWLARAGVKVTLLEGRQIAAGASGRNAGFLGNGTTDLYAATIARHGRAKAKRAWAFSVHNSEMAAGLIAELAERGWDCGYQRNGGMDLAASTQELAEMRSEVGVLREDGWDVTFVEQEDLPQRLRGLYLGGIFHPGNSEVHPVKYVTGLALLASQTGVTLYQQSPVTAFTEHEHSVTLTTPEGTLHASKLILAANAWLPELARYAGLDWLTRAIVPTRGQVLVTEPVGETIFLCPWVADYGYHYCRQVERRLLIGGWRNQSIATENVLDETPGQEIQQHLENFLYEKLKMPTVKIETRWAGVMAFTSDYLPLVGQMPGTRHCFISGGYSGHGNAYAVHSARMVSELVMGKTNVEADLFAPERFQSL